MQGLAARSPRLARWLARRLTGQARFVEADALLAAALARYPGHPRLVVPYAFVAHQGQRHDEALARWTQALAVRPDLPMPWGGLAANARVLGRHERAEEVLAEGLRRFADDPLLVSEAARLADDRYRFADGLVLWRQLVQGPAGDAECWRGYVHDLVKVGRIDDAAAALAAAMSRYPGALPLVFAETVVALAQSEFAKALALARGLTRRFPDDSSSRNLLGHVMLEHGLAAAEGLKIVEVGSVDDDEVRNLLLGFESLGADCEFGLVQRRYGAEPLGLLRWSDAELPSLMEALTADFAGMGSPETTMMVVNPNGEYYVFDSRWGLGMHTFLVAGEVDEAVLLPKMRRRVVFLRDKLVADLKTAAKFFVYRSDEIDLPGLRALHRLLATHGPVRMVNVRSRPLSGLSEPKGPPGTTRQIDANLYIGFLERTGDAGATWDIAFEDWVAVCRSLVQPPTAP